MVCVEDFLEWLCFSPTNEGLGQTFIF
jgi:hypothetical protein